MQKAKNDAPKGTSASGCAATQSTNAASKQEPPKAQQDHPRALRGFARAPLGSPLGLCTDSECQPCGLVSG